MPPSRSSAPPPALWDGEATVLDRGRKQRQAGGRPPPPDLESLVRPAGAWDGEATVLDKHRKARQAPPGFNEDDETERGAPAPKLMPPPPATKPVEPPPPTGEGPYDPDEETVRDKRVLEIPPGGLPEAQPAHAQPERVGPYTLISELGRGGNGIIYLARHQGLERRFAVKLLMASELLDEETVVRFQREAAVASKIDDPGIIGVYDVGKEGDRYYYAMEYVPGRTLEERLRQGPLRAREAAKVVQAVARSIHAAHAHGVIHRDLKPGNIIMEEGSGRPRITDFGVARDTTQQQGMTRTGELLGTPYYMAPEQLLGEKDIDHRVDVYALGVLLYECLTGKRPFEARTAVLLAEKVCTSSPTPLRQLDPSIPQALETVCMQAIARDRNQRQRSAKALAADLEAFLERKAAPAGASAGARGRGVLGDVLGSLQTWHWVALALAACALVAALAFLAKTELDRRSGAAPSGGDPGGSEQALGPGSDLEALRRGLASIDGDPELLERLLRELEAAGDEALLEQLPSLELELAVLRAIRGATKASNASAPPSEVASLFAAARRTAGEDPILLGRVDLAEAKRSLQQGRLSRVDSLIASVPDALRGQAASIEGWRHALNDDDDALGDLLTRFGRERPSDPWAPVAEAWLATLGDGAQRAAQQLRRRLQDAPDDTELLLLHGSSQLALREYRSARRAFEHAAALAPSDVRAQIMLARAQLDIVPQEALRAAREAVALTQPEPLPLALLLQAQAELKLNDSLSARRNLERVLAARPDHVLALLLMGQAVQEDDPRAAADFWDRASRANPRRFELMLRKLPARDQELISQTVSVVREGRQ